MREMRVKGNKIREERGKGRRGKVGVKVTIVETMG